MMDDAIALERAEQRCDRLQARLDEEKALSTALRKQLRESAAATQRTAQQVRQLVGAPNAPEAPGGSVAGLQRTIAGLRDRVDIEKKAASHAHAEKAKLEQRLATGMRERQTLLASQQELRSELQRRCMELDRANAALKDAGDSQEHAMGQVSSLTLNRERDRQQLEKEISDLRGQLELEKKRAANRATRAAAAEAKLRAVGGGSGGIAGGSSAMSCGSSALAGSDAGSVCGGASEVGSALAVEEGAFDFASGRRAMDFDIGEVHGTSGRAGEGTAPSASVSAMASSLETERSKRIEAEAALAVASSEHAAEASTLREERDELRQRAEELEEQLGRRELEAGGSGARSVLRALERQVSDERGKAKAAEAREREAHAQLRSVLGAICSLAESAPFSSTGHELLARETIRELRAAAGESVTPPSAGSREGRPRPHWATASGWSADDDDAEVAATSPEDGGGSGGTGGSGGDGSSSGGDGDGEARVYSPVSRREVERCLEMLERRVRSSDAAAAAGAAAGAVAIGELGSQKASSLLTPASKGTAHSAGKKAMAQMMTGTPLSELSGASAQSPTRKGATGAHGTHGGGSARLSERKQFALADRQKAAASYEQKLARAAAAEERRAATAFDEQMAVAQLSAQPTFDAASRALRQAVPQSQLAGRSAAAGAPTGMLAQSCSDDKLWDRAAALVSSPPAPTPLTRDQIKAQYLERMGSQQSVHGASSSDAPAGGARLCSTTLLSSAAPASAVPGMPISRPSTAGGRAARGSGGRGRGGGGRGASAGGGGMARVLAGSWR
jgi:hypothetical protein